MVKMITRSQLSELVASHGGCIAIQYKGPRKQWGPYAYHVTKYRGNQTWRYLGRVTEEVELWVGKTWPIIGRVGKSPGVIVE